MNGNSKGQKHKAESLRATPNWKSMRNTEKIFLTLQGESYGTIQYTHKSLWASLLVNWNIPGTKFIWLIYVSKRTREVIVMSINPRVWKRSNR